MVSPSARERFDAARLINIANGLTAARVLLVPYFAFLLISGRGKSALLVFAVCGATDVLDGLLARWLRQRTLVGTLLDPIADKLLMATAFIVLSYVHIVPLRLTVMVISRDIIILTGGLIYLLLFGASDLRATGLSKANTAVQILTVIYFLSIAAFPADAPRWVREGGPSRPGRHADVRGHDGRLRTPVPVHRHPEALRCVRAQGTVRRGSASASRPCRTVPRGTGRDRSRGPDPLRVGPPGGGPPRPPFPHVEEPVHPRVAGRVRSRPEKGVSPAGRALGNFPGADPRAPLPQPVRLLLRPPIAEGASTHPVREGRRRPPLLPSRAIRHVLGSFRRGNGEDRPVPSLALYVSIHTTDPELRRRMLGNPRGNDVMPVMRRLTRAGITLHGQIVVCPVSTTARSSPGPSGSFPACVPGSARWRWSRWASLPIGPACRRCDRSRQARRGRRSTCSARWGGNSGKERTGSRSPSPQTNIT